MHRKTAVVAAALVASAALAKVELGTPFADGMVLQRGMPVAVWGTAEAGESVKVCFAGREADAVADGEGRWKARLPELEASKEGLELKADRKSVV